MSVFLPGLQNLPEGFPCLRVHLFAGRENIDGEWNALRGNPVAQNADDIGGEFNVPVMAGALIEAFRRRDYVIADIYKAQAGQELHHPEVGFHDSVDGHVDGRIHGQKALDDGAGLGRL